MRISFGFCLLIGWFTLINGWKMTMIILISAGLHELGHLLVLWMMNAPIKGLRIGVLGAVLDADTRNLSYGKELAAVLAGPTANMMSALVGKWTDMSVTFIGVNLMLCGFNLLPVEPLDGGRALRLALCWLLGPDKGERLTQGIGSLSAFGMAVILGAVMKESGGSLWLLPPMIGMLLLTGRGFGRKNKKYRLFL